MVVVNKTHRLDKIQPLKGTMVDIYGSSKQKHIVWTKYSLLTVQWLIYMIVLNKSTSSRQNTQSLNGTMVDIYGSIKQKHIVWTKYTVS